MSIRSFSTGKPVYGGGSFAPTRGQVSAVGAQGYIQRELKKQGQGPYGGVSTVGSDGKSDTRSGIAANALGKTNGFPSTPPTPANPGSTTNTPSPTTPQTPGLPSQPEPPKTGNSGGSNSGGGINNPTPTPPPPPQVVSNSTGQLQLPYDQQFSADVLAALDDYNSQLLDLQMQSQQEGLDYVKNRRDTDIKYEDTKRKTLSSNASRGTAFSSGYGVAVGNNARDYQNSINDQDAQHSLFQQMNALKRGSIETAYQRMLSQAALDYAGNLDDDAGDLGYGTDAPVNAPVITPSTTSGSGYTVHGGNWTTGGNGTTTIKNNKNKNKDKNKHKPKK